MAALSDLIAPASTAVLTMEVQRAVVGDQAALPALAAEVAEAMAFAEAGAWEPVEDLLRDVHTPGVA